MSGPLVIVLSLLAFLVCALAGAIRLEKERRVAPSKPCECCAYCIERGDE